MHERRRPTTRRGFLAGAATLGGAALAGCTGVVGLIHRRPAPVTVLAAGSLQHAFETGLRGAVSRPLRIEAHGSAAVVRLIREGQRDPDLVALADVALFRPLAVGWHARFATNALVVAYNPDTAAGRRVGAADRPFDSYHGEGPAPVLGRTDPDLDPLGYRTLFALALAADRYDEPGLAAAVLGASQVYPETELLAGFETGGMDAAIVYRSMAVERGYPSRALPAAVDLSDPAQDDRYAARSYALPDGTTVRGAPIRYGAVLRRDSAAARSVLRTLVAADYLRSDGFVVPDGYPRLVGDAPGRVRAAVEAPPDAG